MNESFKNVFEYKVIYVFSINDQAHQGLIKIGDATIHTSTPVDALTPNCRELNQAALKRIKSYTNTAGITPTLLHSELATRMVRMNDGTTKLQAFRDHDVHTVLMNSGFDKIKIGESTGREWFDVDIETAKSAINAVKLSYANLSNTDHVTHTPVVFRPEQNICIEKVVNHFKIADRFLINAKMRYGKTFVSLEIIKRCQFSKTIILTHRPVVNEGWYEDFTKIFYGENDYIYGSKKSGYSVADLEKTGKKFVYFASVQDLRGSKVVNGKYDKNLDVFETEWDCVIVDEAHEGTTTALGEETVNAVVKSNNHTKFLALSGTPFNILEEYDDKSIYTWDYIMEQENKSEWDKYHFGDSNPYEELPELRIYTYSLGDILHNNNYIAFEDKAFNFHEFFRTWEGDAAVDHDKMPSTAHIGDFVHEADIVSFLNLLTKTDTNNCYPFSTNEYRNLFKHTFWTVPGVKEATALKKLMLQNNVFGNGHFNIVNVAGDGDPQDKNEEALKKVKKAIKEAGDDDYTITLSCGKLTTGVTVKEWTGVFMLSGSYSTSASNYLQTIFRVQSPCNVNGKLKETSYVFDFAPDRTLKMVSTAVSISTRAGKTKIGDKKNLGKFLNYCPVISISGSEMKEYNAEKLLQQVKRVYAEKVVRNGFDDTNLYNDELFKLQDIDIKKFNDLKGIIGTSKAAPQTKEIPLNNQGLTNEEYAETEKLKKKAKKDLTPEEKARLEELKQTKKLRNDAISILRGISIRMPLLIYGANIPYDEDITLDKFVELVDQSSWDEFMPEGVSKEVFKEFQKYYDEEVFIAAGRRIRDIAKAADSLDPTERVKRIAGLFSYFKNPDKETVLTPWRVVNMHMSDCLGGWDFWDKQHQTLIEMPRFVEQGQSTRKIFMNPDVKILEINSKTGLYPLYVTYSIYMSKCKNIPECELSASKRNEIWCQTVKDNVFVICKTEMARAITKRTLLGYADKPINSHCFDDLVNMMSNKTQQFKNRVSKYSFWKKEGEGSGMKFDAIVGNPPYQEQTGGGMDNGKFSKQAKPIFNLFVEQAKELNPDYISMIIPARWYNGGIGLSSFREEMFNDNRLTKLYDFYNSKDCFPTVVIPGGLCYFLWDDKASGDCEITNVLGDERDNTTRALNQYEVFVRNNKAVTIIDKVLAKAHEFLNTFVSPLDTFGLPTNEHGHETKNDGDLVLIHSATFNSQGSSYIERSKITKNEQLIDKYKVKISRMIPQGGEVGIRPENGYRSISTPQILQKNEVDTFSYLNVGFFDTKQEAINYRDYLTCKFTRYMLRTTYSGLNVSQNNFIFVPKMDYTQHWDDNKLYKYFELSEGEIAMIESTMRPMNLTEE